ncbi:TonB-dependent receptor [Gilvimarinus algae]|uniref:TonB-dependent receptor n=1 Tax=Gilvimarinus algae TaxID=3058037 RepID=A0ABT8THZ9_9GAMM|nr:TonB-dependent receptor [Gilvimarinus sp. SDUM040014]MDO3383109.1 TonB-dependent receptor [Gilvimarinus sp. SDUM040014]
MIYRDNTKKVVPFKKSMLAICVMAMGSPALAQDTSENVEALEEIVVSGTRQNLQNAQDIKRDADTFVDAISAEDIGSLPDRSVLEAMQRMPGVSIERFAAPEDPDHFGVEGSGAVIRGMSATRSEFNGRDSFTANSGRGLNFQDVPPELMSGVDLYKNQTADMIEGGIGGTVSLKTRKPFNQDGQMIAFTGDVSYGDIAEETSPTFSGLYSNRWDTESLGEFGFLINASYSELIGESHGIQSDAFVKYNADTLGAPSSVADAENQVWMTNGSNFFTKEDDRVRKGLAASFQWASPDDTLEATAEFIRSDARLSWKENAIKYQGGYGDENDDGSVSETRRARPYPGTEFLFDDRGIFQAGYITDGGGWRGGEGRVPRSWSGEGDVPEDYVTQNDYFGQKYQADTRFKDTHTIVDDASFNLKWMPNDAWELEGDFQYVKATTEDDDLQIANGIYGLQQFDMRGDTPKLTVIEPWDGRRDANPEYYAEEFPGFSGDPAGDSNYFQDPDSYWWRSAMDHYERSEGESKAVRFDATRYFDNVNFFRSVKAGVRFADRNQIVRTTPYNWGHIGAEWAPGGGEGALWLSETEELSGDYEYIDWSDFHRGGVANVPGNGFLFATEDFLKEVIDGRTVPQNNPGAEGVWEPANLRPEVGGNGTYFSDAEIYDTTETNKAAYVRLDFGSDETALRFSGNIGLRYVELDRDAIGSIQYPDMIGQAYPDGAPTDLTDSGAIRKWAEEQVGPFDPGLFASEQDWLDEVNDLMSYSRDANNWLSQTEQDFGNNVDEAQEDSASWDGFLPSFNLKLELTDDLIARFAVAKAIALPDMSEVRNQAVLGAQQLVVTRETDTSEISEPGPVDDGVNILEVDDVQWTGSGGNPGLQPMESIQYDASVEWYFAPVGSLTVSLFYKDLSNFFIEGAIPRTFTNPSTGVSQTVDFTTTRNGEEGKMQGFEIAYQQFYDMLPEPFDGFGIQANYTFIDSEGVPNFTSDAQATTEDDLDDSGPDTPQPGLEVVDLSLLEGLPLRGQSEHTANLVLMYEKNDWSARLAYNWRSKYLVTTRDVISGQPIWNDDAGFLDGSVQYTVNDYFTVGLQATNLLDTQTETLMTLDENGRETGRSWFINDRRLAFTMKFVY